MEAESGSESELETLKRDYQWLLSKEMGKALCKAALLVGQVCAELPGGEGEAGLRPLRLELESESGGDAVKATVSLYGEKVAQVDVAIRYPKAPSGTFRSSAQPDSPWILHQIQDLSNYCIRAQRAIEAGVALAEDGAKLREGRAMVLLDEILGLLQDASNALLLPRKRSLAEIMEFAPAKSFLPSLPPDLLLSLYVSGDRLLLSAYNLVSATGVNRPHTFTVASAAASLPFARAALAHLALAARVLQQLRDNLQAATRHPALQPFL